MGLYESFAQGGQQSGSGGYISRVTVEIGFLSFKKGYSPDDRFFRVETPENIENLEEQELQNAWAEATEVAAARAEKFDPGNPNNWRERGAHEKRVFRLTISKDDCLNREMAGDRHFDLMAYWERALQEVFIPSLEAVDFDFERETNAPFWAHVTTVQDPWQAENQPEVTVEDNNFRWIPRVLRRFSSREEAAEFAASRGGDVPSSVSSGIDAPEGWNPEDNGRGSWSAWLDTAKTILWEEMGDLSDKNIPQRVTAVNEAVTAVYPQVNDDNVEYIPESKLREIATKLANGELEAPIPF